MGKELLIILAIGAGITGVWLHGNYYGREQGRVKQLEDTVRATKDRADVDEDVANRNNFDLCVSIGGMPDDCAQLRGVDETADP